MEEFKNDEDRLKFFHTLRIVLRRWKNSGKITTESFQELEKAIQSETKPKVEKKSIHYEDYLGEFVDGINKILQTVLGYFISLFEPMVAKEEQRKEGHSEIYDTNEENFSGVGIFNEIERSFKQGKTGIESVLWLGIKPLLNEYIWWFIGSVLVLTGSVMGIREAFNVLSGTNRYITVLFALFLYKFLFTGLGLFLSRSSQNTGRILAGISILLIPISYSFLGSIIIENITLGAILILLSSILTYILFLTMSNLFHTNAMRMFLPMFPSMLSISILPLFQNLEIGMGILFVPLMVIFFTFKDAIDSKKKAILLLAFYGAISVLIIFFTEFRKNEAILFEIGSLSLGIFFLWLLGLSCVLIYACEGFKDSNTEKFYLALEVTLLAIPLTLALASLYYFFNITEETSGTNLSRTLYTLVPICTLVLLFLGIQRFKQLIHPFFFIISLLSFILARELRIEGISLAVTPFVPILSIFFRNKFSNLRLEFILWSVCSGVLISLMMLFSNSSIALISFGIFFPLVMHIAFFRERVIYHLAGGLGIMVLSKGIILEFLTLDTIYLASTVLFLSFFIYYLFSIVYENYFKEEEEKEFRPFDDLSLLFGLAGILITVNLPMTNQDNILIAGIFTGIIFLTRAWIDKTVLVSIIAINFICNLCFKLSLNYLEISSIAGNFYLLSFISLLTSAISLILPGLGEQEKARKILFVLRLPFPSGKFEILKIAFGLNSLLYFFIAIGNILPWFSSQDFPERSLAIQGGLLLCLVATLGFFTNTILSFFKGNVISFATIFVCIGLTAIINRIGRPLEPLIVGRNLTIVVIVIYLFYKLIKRFSFTLANFLEKPEQGKFYPYVPLNIVLGLGILLFIDVLLIVPNPTERFLFVTPPTFFLGAGIAFFFYAREVNFTFFLDLSLFGFLLFLVLSFSESTFLGTKLIQTNPPIGIWLPSVTFERLTTNNFFNPSVFLPDGLSLGILVLRATIGVAIFGLILSFLIALFSFERFRFFLNQIILPNWEEERVYSSFAIWSSASSLVLFLVAFKYAFFEAAIILLVAGILLRIPKQTRIYGSLVIFISGLLILEGFIFKNSIFPFYGGIIHTTLGFLFVASVNPIKKYLNNSNPRLMISSQTGMIFYSIIGILYAFATNQRSDFDNAIPSLLAAFGIGISGSWILSYSLGATLVVIAMSLFLASNSWKNKVAFLGTLAGSLILSTAILTLFPKFSMDWNLLDADLVTVYPSGYFGYYSFITSSLALIFYVLKEFFKNSKEDVSDGFYLACDSLIIITGVFAIIGLNEIQTSMLIFSKEVFLGSIINIIILSAIASYQNLQARHLYVLQTSIVFFYLSLRTSYFNSLSPQVDGIVALIAGFFLVGVTSIADRKKIPPLAETTRRFAGFLPVFAFFVLPKESSYGNAGMALFSSILYSTLGQVSSNKLYTVIGAFAANFAIFTAVMATNVNGLEIYIAPIGLFILLLSHIFRENLNDTTKQILRLVGGIFLYLPAAIKISFDIGLGAEPIYSVVFGLICFIGILLGMIFEIRSYVYLGTVFFTLNIIANLVQEGLRNERIGFILLSLSGLMIIGSLIFYTLKKEFVLSVVIKIRAKVSKWE
ncbi:MAG: hypothetical protein SFU98_10090 [Leptospiraceae bacterium]|nr:hypothetical protein [Leptospiraceae bacterium]